MYKIVEDGEEKIFHSLISSIQLSLNSRNWYSAIFLSLAVPDICSSVDSPNTHSTAKRYTQWFNSYMSDRKNCNSVDYGYLTAEDCYALRCSMYHHGVSDISMQKKKKAIEGVVFLATGEGFKLHNCKLPEDKISIDITEFCLDMIYACQKWINFIINDKGKVQHLNNIMQIRDLSDHTTPELFNMFFNQERIITRL